MIDEIRLANAIKRVQSATVDLETCRRCEARARVMADAAETAYESATIELTKATTAFSDAVAALKELTQ